jgi:hypothetical protein
MGRVASFITATLVTALATGCATTYTQTRWVTHPLSGDPETGEGGTDIKQQHDGVSIERHTVRERTADMVGPECGGGPITFKRGVPVIESLRISNGTDHVLRLSNITVKLFDPQGDASDLVFDKTEADHKVEVALSCTHVNKLRWLNRSVEILPHSTWSGYAMFDTSAHPLRSTGTWKFGFYEVPTETDAVGNVTKTTVFEFNIVTKRIVDTFTKPAFGTPSLVGSMETSATE